MIIKRIYNSIINHYIGHDTFYPEIVLGKMVGSNKDWVVLCNVKFNNFTIPAGFKTDLASVPRIFWSIVPPQGNTVNASVVHDYMYRNNLQNRKFCDDAYLKLLLNCGIKKWQSYAMYYCVRIFGLKRWNKYKNK